MRACAALVTLASLGCATGGQLGAQTSGDGEALLRLEADVEVGRLDGVRDAVEAWLVGAKDASAETIGQARYLRARLMTDVDSARTEYLAVAIEGRSTYGAKAWLRLAQLDLAVGEPMRAAADLERLRADYPRGAIAALSWYWTARALEERGQLEDACDTYERAVNEAERIDETATVERAMMAADQCASVGLRFSIQVGAFSRAATARELRDELETDGFPARVFEQGGLHRVRVGWFARPETARALERRLRDGGFTVAVVAAES